MDEQQLSAKIKEFNKKLPHFADGRTDFSNFPVATVMNVFVKHKDTFLLLKRSDKVSTYKGLWNSIGGYLDDLKPLSKKVLEELREETGIKKESISEMKFKEVYEYADESVKKTWITLIVVVELLSKPKIKLDWEHTEYVWVNLAELKGYSTIPHLDTLAAKAFDL